MSWIQTVSESHSVVSDSLWLHGILQARTLEWVAFLLSKGSSQPSDQTQIKPALQVDSLPPEPQGKPRDTGVGSLSLQGNFLTQESNQGLLIAGGFFTSWAIREAIDVICKCNNVYKSSLETAFLFKCEVFLIINTV